MSHTGIDLESIEAVILFVIVRQDVNSALHKSPMRFFALYEFPYTSVLETRPADELLCRCLYTPYVVVVVCCLEATALHCLVALCGCPCLVLAVLGCWPFFGRSSRFSVQMTSQAVTSWGSASGQSAKQTGVSFVGQWRIDTEIFSGSVTSLEYCWRGNLPQPQSNQDTPWFSSSLDCQVK